MDDTKQPSGTSLDEAIAASDEFDDEEFEYDDDVLDEQSGRSNSRKLKLHCFHCNRAESHYTANKGLWFHSYLVGLTFGVMSFIGPFKCRCCGHKRLLRANSIHPKFWNSKSATKFGARSNSKP